MKKIAISFTVLSLFACADLSIPQIEKMVAQIHEKREGVKLETLDQTKEPFVRSQEGEDKLVTFIIPEKKEDAKLILHAIVNGKAYINDQWVGIEEKVMGYTLKYIGKRGVVLRNENNIKKLFLSEGGNDFIQIEERK
ncbi:hypothetical protein PGH07_02380 [Sulfurovum sp. zt1-1]|uniref:Lipoprotein n=1 Tax=Sulfurovum zhangzhouensis TaxID=3019067 RepID=A0ABT7QW03_9BACT|nr:hypothetical protein [Sulfurovum zhangzhouensis]MDM5271019.1 hypothetical protein [Sulfurovum zhangzhouensis]